MSADPLSHLKPPERALVEFYANPANTVTYNNEIRSAQAAGYEKYTPAGIRRLFRRKAIQCAIDDYAQHHGIAAPVKTADDAVSERQDKLLDDIIELNILDVMEEVEIARVDDLGNLYYERHYQPKSLREIQPLGRFMKGFKIDPKKDGQKFEVDFHDKLSAMRLRSTIKKRIGGDQGGGGHAPVVNIIIPSIGAGQEPMKVVSPDAGEEGEDA